MLLNPRTLLLLPILLLATLALSATPASASPLHFGEPGEGAGQLNQPLGVAVDESTAPTDSSAGDVYVADEHNNRVDKFGPDGEFLLAWGWGVANGEEKLQACGPATGPSTEACHAGRSGPGAGEFHALRAVAVDASDQPLDDSEGDVYVLEEDNSRVDKFGPDGEFLLAWGWGVATGANEFQECGPEASPKPTETCEQGREGTGAGEFELKGGALTLGATGEVYVGDVSRVQVFGSDGKLARTVTIGPPEEFVDDIALDPAGDIYASFRNDRGVFEYKPCVGSCVAEQAGPPLETRSEDYFGLAPGGELFVSDGERLLEFAGGSLIASAPSPQNQAEGVAFDAQNGQLLVSVRSQGAVFAQAPLPPGPDVETEEATAEPAGTATLRASIYPEGKQTKYHLVYCMASKGGL
jgi:hypothetical protein